MNNKLSHSSTRLFMECGMKYKYHYVDKLRSKELRAALLFGTAIDKAIDALLSKGDAEAIFEKYWNFQEAFGKLVHLANHPEIVYADSDFDKDLLTQADWDKLNEKYNVSLDKILEIRSHKNKVSWKYVSNADKSVHNHANWLCLRRKGLLMIDAIRREFLPVCEEIIGTQIACELNNSEGDRVVGYVDMVARIKGYDKPVILDLKTSARPYEEDSVLTSPQLTLYVHALSEAHNNTRLAGYVVLSKQIQKNKVKICSACGNNGSGKTHKTCDAVIENKRCGKEWIETVNPKATVQLLINEIPERTETLVIENIDAINKAIHSGVFVRNLNSCTQAYGKCQFYNKCYEGSDEGLEQT